MGDSPQRVRWTGPEPIVLALGSNLGDRKRHLELACRRLERRGIQIVRASRLYETLPLSGSGGLAYLNACLLVRTALSPHELLRRCLGIEREAGRVRRERWGARPLDIDLIFYGRQVHRTPALTLPHPAWRDRDFVLRGIMDLDADIEAAPPMQRSARFQRWLQQAERCIVSVHIWPFPSAAKDSTP